MKRQEVTRSRRWKSDHGFKRGQALYLDDDGVLQLACADTEQRARCVGVVDDYITRDSFVLSGPGTIIENLEDLTTGQVYYLDPVTPGALTTTAPEENCVEVLQATSDRTASVLLRTMSAGTSESPEGSEPIALAHISENHEAHDASAIAVVPVGDLEADNVQDALGELDEDLTAHIEDTADAHAASAITNTPAGSIAATDVQSAINELDGDVTAVAADLAAHLADTTDAHDASAISSVPAGTLAATDVQAALNELDGDVQAHLADTTDAHDASAISNVPAGNIAATTVQGAIDELDSEKASTGSVAAVAADLAAHIADTTDAHAASAITNTPAGNIAATTVQAALNELDSEKATTGSVAAVASDLAAHLADTTDAHDASAISNVPAGNIASTDVQGAINELDSEKASTGSVSAVASDLAAHIADTTDAHAASAITNTPAGSVAATTVQGAINELDTEKVPTTRAINTAANSGMAGGGDLSTDRSISRDITNNVAETTIADDDLFELYDTSAGAHRKMTKANVVAGLSGGSATPGVPPFALGDPDFEDPVASRIPPATTINFRQFVGAFVPVPVNLTDASTIATDASKGNLFRVTLGGNRTMGAPTNPTDGQVITYEIKQDGSGNRTISSWDGVFDFTTSIPAPTLQTAADKIDCVSFRYISGITKWRVLGFNPDDG